MVKEKLCIPTAFVTVLGLDIGRGIFTDKRYASLYNEYLIML